MHADSLLNLTHYLPLCTTVVSAWFAWVILSRWGQKRQSYHLLWWGLGVITFGGGTLVESLNTLLGWHEVIFKSWYILGALLGGAPLAIGTIYLQYSKRVGHIAVAILVSVVTVVSIFVILSPIKTALIDPGILNSKVLEWQQIRLVSPFINSLAAIFLIGGAIASAIRFSKKRDTRNRFIGNVLIAVGAILPGVGGSFSRLGYTEVLYVTELLGIIGIFAGYRYCQRPVAAFAPQAVRQSEPGLAIDR